MSLDSYFSLESLLALQGATAAALLIPAVLVYLFSSWQSYAKYISFVIAIALAYLAAVVSPEVQWTKWVLALFNGFIIAAAAFGINQWAAARDTTPVPFSRSFQPVSVVKNFFSSWL